VAKQTEQIPLYKKLFDFYTQAILTQEYMPGDRIDSINEIQEKHGVSRETAKRILKNLAEEGFISQHPGKGSFVVPLGPRKPVWGIVVPFFSAHMEQLIQDIVLEADHARRSVVHFVDYNRWEEEMLLVGRMIRDRYEAVIVVPTFDETKTAQFYRSLKSGGTLVTLLDHTMAGSHFTYAIQSYDLGVKRGVGHLLSRTRGTLAFLKNSIWAGRNMVQEVMEETFKICVAEAGNERRAAVIERVTDLNPERLRQDGIDGFFCCDDTDAVRVVGRLREWGIAFPGGVSVVSYGNTELARFFTPRITSIDPHAEEMAARTAQMIKAYGRGEDTRFCQYVIQPDLVVRET
jgi:DNA-binding LacI/PurR family transcriptional regulator